MRRRAFFAVLALAVVVAAGCDVRTLDPPGTAPLRYRDKIFSAVTKTDGITYGSAKNRSGDTITLKLDLYAPTGDKVTKRPAIVWVHGGSFCCLDRTSGELVDESNNFAKEGFVNASIDYRLEPGGCSAAKVTQECIDAIHEAMADAQTAVRFLKSHATTYGIDPTRIAIGGSSAGAITALNVAYQSSEQPASSVRAAVSLSGANLFGKISAGDPPALLFHGTADTTVPYAWAVSTVKNATAKGLLALLTSWDGDGHVPYGQHHDQILQETRNFLYWEMDLKDAAS